MSIEGWEGSPGAEGAIKIARRSRVNLGHTWPKSLDKVQRINMKLKWTRGKTKNVSSSSKEGTSSYWISFFPFLIILSHCLVGVLGDQEIIQSIRQQLTPSESIRIFGSSEKAHVPNFDIVSPRIFHRKIRRKPSFNHDQRSILRSPHFDPDLDPHHHDNKIIQIHGLGQNFHLRLRPNPNLISSPEFLHLFRHHNHSVQVLPDSLIKKHLKCFYHGSIVELPTVTVAHHPNESRRGGPQDRVTEKSQIKSGLVALDLCDGMKGFIIPTDGISEDHYVIHPIPGRFRGKTNDDLESQRHFLWKRPSGGLLSKITHGGSREGHHGPQPSGGCSHHDENEMNREKGYPATRSNRKSRHTRSTSKERLHHDPDPFPYRPLSIASDSYWYRYRTSESPPLSTPLGHQGSSESQLRLSDGLHPNNHPSKHEWSRSISIYESPEDGTSESRFPFYTQRSGSESRWYPFPSLPQEQPRDDGKESIDRAITGSFGGTLGDSYYHQLYNYTGGGGADNRRGRGDESIFGSGWKSSLDSDPMTMSPSGSAYTQNTISKLDKIGTVATTESMHITIETAVFVDKDLYKHMETNFPDDTQEEVTRIVLAMINAVQLLYSDPSLGHRVDFVLKRLEVLSSDPPGLLRQFDIDRYLTNFCKWQRNENPTSDSDPLHWDHALMLTGLDLYVVHQSGKISNQVVGLAPVAGMCTRSSSCTVNEGRHFESVYVMAHELGHNLGMRHDGPQAENECDPTSHIMSPTLGSGKITWSPCSKRYLDMFLETSQSKCLLDKGTPESRLDHDADGRLPGERFDADRQCVLKYGRGSFHAVQQPLEDVCRDLHCRREHYTWTSHPALEGTFCGLDKWCRAGKCLPKYSHSTTLSSNPKSSSNYNHPSAPQGHDPPGYFNNYLGETETAAYSTLKALDGGWGKWSPFTDCSSACLYASPGAEGDGTTFEKGSTGIRLAARRCDSPRPENGGMQCGGLDRRYKTCNLAQICPPSAPHTTISQYASEVCQRAAVVDTELTGHGFMTNTNDPERACSVWCETGGRTGSRSRGWSFPDGTRCKLVTNPEASTFCVAGKCQEFTCDPESHYGLSDEECVQGSGLSPLGVTSSRRSSKAHSWFGHPSSLHNIAEVPSYFGATSDGLWGPWVTQSDCKLTCLAPAKGLELVKRICLREGVEGMNLPHCPGLSVSVRLCKPDSKTILEKGCSRLQTPFEFATLICTKYSDKVTGLSGIGMQLSPTKDDPDRPCRIGCQDSALSYRFYMVNGEEGWFPAGTDCSRGDPSRKAYCLGGRCVDFGQDDTPIYKISSKILGRFESFYLRRRRRKKRGLRALIASSGQIQGQTTDQVSLKLDEIDLRDLIREFSSLHEIEIGNGSQVKAQVSQPQSPRDHLGSRWSLDLSHPVLLNQDDSLSSESNSDFRVGTKNVNLTLPSSLTLTFNEELKNNNSVPLLKTEPFMELEGTFYEWRKIVSDCSVSCGSGVQEIIIQCVSGDEVVPDESLCKGHQKPPGKTGYERCWRPSCRPHEAGRGFLTKWFLQLAGPNPFSVVGPSS